MMQLFMRLFGKRVVHKAVASQVQSGTLDLKLGFTLLRDKRVPLQAKLMGLGIGLAVVAALIALEIPVEGLLGLFLPFFAIPLDMMVDGLETVIGPILIGALLMPYVAPQQTVSLIQAERSGGVIEAQFTEGHA